MDHSQIEVEFIKRMFDKFLLVKYKNFSQNCNQAC